MFKGFVESLSSCFVRLGLVVPIVFAGGREFERCVLAGADGIAAVDGPDAAG